VQGYLQALAGETVLAGRTPDLDDSFVSSIYIGGGTPTVLTGDQLDGVLAAVGREFSSIEGCEVTVEANPGTVDRGKLKAIKAAGANRLSLGVQSLEAGVLKRIGRKHGPEEVYQAFDLAREIGFAVNLDLIFALPGQTPDGWRETIRNAAAMGPEHISTYGLKVETGTPLARMIEQGVMNPCLEDEEAAMYEDTVAMLTACGYIHYEISNFARPGHKSKHNCHYWENGEYIGLGAGAHSHLNHRRWANCTDLVSYMEMVNRGELPVAEVEHVSLDQEMAETMFLGLRLIEGINMAAFERRFGVPVDGAFGRAIARHKATGLLTVDDGRLKLSPRGLLLANEVFVDFLAPEIG